MEMAIQVDCGLTLESNYKKIYPLLRRKKSISIVYIYTYILQFFFLMFLNDQECIKNSIKTVN